MDSFLMDEVRQKCIKFMRAEKIWKKNTPKGKKYAGYKFKVLNETNKDGWREMGWKVIPVYKKRLKEL